MGAPAWTAKEISALEEMTAKYPLPTVARKLNRSVSAVFLKQQRLGIGGLRQNSDTIREIAEKMNRSESSIKYKLYRRNK